MRYAKPALNPEQQADLLLSRGFIGDRDALIKRLEVVGYYRLCAYWHPFKMATERFQPNTTLDMIWERYLFDRRLRLMIMDAIERIEIALRSALTVDLTMRFGPFAHLDARAFPDARRGQHEEFLDVLFG